MAAALSAFMESYPSMPLKRESPMPLLTTRQHRRKAIRQLVRTLVQVRDSEEAYRDNIPGNLAGSSAYDAADESAAMMSEAIDILENAYQ